MNRIKPDKIHLVGVNIFKSNLNATQEYLDNPIAVEEINVGYSQESGISVEEKRVRVRLEIQLNGIDNEAKEIGLTAEYGIEFQYVVDNIEDFLVDPDTIEDDLEEETPLISGVLGGTIMGITYSTARGIILERTQGTFFDGVILPVINPNTLI